MAISTELFKAILSMDSYNRGYGQGINLAGTQIGNATILLDSSILKTADGETRLDIPVGFYASAYILPDGEIVVSYRGTNADGLLNFTEDAIYGYWTGGGIPGDSQSKLAVQFYNALKAQYPAPISLTGHSLGGGLAGYVGALNGKQVAIFDNMTYEDAVNSAYNKALHAYNESLPTFTGTKTATQEEIDLWQNIYGGDFPTPPVFTGNAYYTQGELLGRLLFLRGEQHLLPFGFDVTSNRSALDLHSIALLVTLMYAKENNLTDWKTASKPFIDSLFNSQIANTLGLHDKVNGVYGAAQQMLSMIAYSAIDGATDGVTVFGDTAIRAMFDDANELGKVMGFSNLSSALKDIGIVKTGIYNLKETSAAISDILVQFAGQLAIGHMMKSGDDDPLLKGILALSSDQNTLKIDLDPLLWSIGTNNGQPVSTIVGRKEIIDALASRTITYGQDSAGDPTQTITVNNDLSTGMKLLWNDVDGNNIDSITYATHNAAFKPANDNFVDLIINRSIVA